MAKKTKPAGRGSSSGSRRSAASDRIQGIQSVEIGFSVLDVLADSPGPLTLGEAARRAGLSLSQTRRYLVSLVRCGLATQDDATGLYDLGSRALRVGLAALARVEAIDLATAALKELVARTLEGGTLAVWGDGGPTVVRWFRGGGIGVTSLGLGTVFPLFASATGHVFLTYLTEDNTRGRLERELGARFLASPEGRRAVDGVKAKVRKSGFGWLKGHFVENIRGAAAPVFDSQGELVAVLAIAGPDGQATDGDPSVQALVEAAAQVSRQLCFSGIPRVNQK
ncbi:IclR family transcriptional regulator [Bradyrhizobium sp. U87765 SZCCT0131]|uniref:IclR family transcriptional regulator n=1 Tax=unclassified Bradyrhizobium TaxID=2631580 RepID=UPI001BAAA412|nr:MULTISPECIES: IclR family transcriptional regulator [unclassified Bradyrhizobium]MBR1221750.1 IclR family transcriptional regulator [Bradyrhizobium sp. U87765 SZCCT0131]MBR1264327.1 IclR family transcriptional regulator [Bradyrhizobium sp. U87765 SZCCT0134]MBR1304766.1 IclR family transcriptional regulator [Bradyrhizobium sp. U87765 SZCCT0110]MBR1324102.1 IclR family transcriptional regulator [Bradyrhizobium sp. U87765 SZCCT0109]MBR1346695.1 IclR family transcriptional regulator [Bradyrhizo